MEFEKISKSVEWENNILKINSEAFFNLAQKSFTEMRKFFREEHLEHWKEIFESSESSDSEKEKMLRNLKAAVESKNSGVPYCQDTGTDIAYIFRGNKTVIEGEFVESEIEKGALWARENNPYRSSVLIPDEKKLEKNSGNNLPAEVHFFSHKNEDEISGIFCNKGGGSGSKLWSFSESPAIYADKEKLMLFLKEKMVQLGHSACPPYQLRIVLGGLSHFQNSEFLTRMTVDDFSFISEKNPENFVLRDLEIEKFLTSELKKSNMGAQGDGKFFVMPDGIRVVRAPRHAAHFFLGIGVACSAHRVQAFKINNEGVFLEKLCKNPEKFLPEKKSKLEENKNLKILDLNPLNPPCQGELGEEKIYINLSEDRSLNEEKLRKIKAGDLFFISGKILGARDKAHARWYENFKNSKKIPDYLKQFLAVFYVGPSDTPKGDIIGSFGPTTAGRMDIFSDFLFSNNLLPLSIAKGTRSENFSENCKKYKGMFCAIQGGPASELRKFVKSVKILDFEDLGMEAVRVYEVENIPVQMIVDASGEDFYKKLSDSFLKN